jgi:hypothetical protein
MLFFNVHLQFPGPKLPRRIYIKRHLLRPDFLVEMILIIYVLRTSCVLLVYIVYFLLKRVRCFVISLTTSGLV